MAKEWNDYGIKVRSAGGKSWAFLAAGGGTNRLSIHAVRFTVDAVIPALLRLRRDNPGREFKRVVL
jgi:hypothetical protein